MSLLTHCVDCAERLIYCDGCDAGFCGECGEGQCAACHTCMGQGVVLDSANANDPRAKEYPCPDCEGLQ